MDNKSTKNRGRGRRNRRDDRQKDEFEQKLVEIKRVTRVTGGGKQLSFRAAMVVGDKKGRVGVAAAKGKDVSSAIGKAVNKAKKELIKVQIINGTIAHGVDYKFKAAKIMLKPAKQGRGVIAGGAVRMVLELAGVENIVSKIRGSNSKLNNIKATVRALDSLMKVEEKSKGKAKNNKAKKETSKKATNKEKVSKGSDTKKSDKK